METSTRKKTTLLMILCWTAYAAQYVTKYSIQVCLTGMRESGIFTESFGGTVVTSFFFSYAIGQFVNGWLGDKINPRYMIGTGLLGASAMNLLMGVAEVKAAVLVIWCLNGWFCSMLWAPVLRCTAEFIPSSRRSAEGASLSATSPCGLLIIYALGGIFLKISSYKAVFFGASCIGAAIALFWIFGTNGIKDIMAPHAEANDPGAAPDGGSRIGGKKLASLLFASGAAFAFACIAFNGVLKDGVSAWTHTYLVTNFGVTESFASVLLMALPFVNLAGAFSAVRLFRKANNELLTTAVMFAVSAISTGLLTAAKDAGAVFAVAMLALSSAAMLGANTMLLTFLPMRFASVGRAAALTGMLDTASYMSSAASGAANGAIIEHGGWDILLIVWVCLALAGAAFAVTGALKWRKGKQKAENVDLHNI